MLQARHLAGIFGCRAGPQRRTVTSSLCRFSNTPPPSRDTNAQQMHERSVRLRQLVNTTYKQRCHVNSDAVFAINQIDFGSVDVYGFDYDYTLAQYDPLMQNFIYDQASRILVGKYHFPAALAELKYQPNFCIRGLHYDVARSLLMKVDAFHIIQQGTVYRGLRQLEVAEVRFCTHTTGRLSRACRGVSGFSDLLKLLLGLIIKQRHKIKGKV